MNYSSDSINNLNKLFRQQYAEARNSQLTGVSPVIIVRSDNLVLLRDGKRLVGTTVHPNYHGQMKLGRGELSDAECKRLYILIPGASLPRKNSLAVGYFAKLFEQECEGNRVIYAESQFDESQDLQLLATHLFDSRIGELFFDDSSRMNRDLLGPSANAYLDSLDFETLRRTGGETGAGR